jgi:hypothetical protein
MVIALTPGLAGIPRDLILRDYPSSGPNMPHVVEKLNRLPRYRNNIQRFPASLYECRQSSMLMFLDAVESDHGSFQGWARSVGVSEHTTTTLRTTLTNTPQAT